MSASSEPLLCTGADQLKLWEISSANLVKTFPTSSTAINCISWNHSNQAIATGSKDGVITLYHVSGAQLGTLSTPSKSEILCLSFSSGSRYLCVGSSEGVIHIWDLKKKEIVKDFKMSDAVTGVTFNATDSHLASSSANGEVVLYGLATGQLVAQLKAPDQNQAIKDLKYSPFKKHMLVGCSDDGSVHLWDTTNRTTLHTWKQHHAPASAISFSPVNQLLLASAGLDKRVVFYDIVQNKVVKTITTESPLTTLAFSEDGVKIVVGTSTGKLLIYDLRESTKPTIDINAHLPFAINALQFQHFTGASKTSKQKGSESATKPSTTSATGSAASAKKPQPTMASLVDQESSIVNTSKPVNTAPTNSNLPPAPQKEKLPPPSDMDLFSPLKKPQPKTTTNFELKKDSFLSNKENIIESDTNFEKAPKSQEPFTSTNTLSKYSSAPMTSDVLSPLASEKRFPALATTTPSMPTMAQDVLSPLSTSKPTLPGTFTTSSLNFETLDRPRDDLFGYQRNASNQQPPVPSYSTPEFAAHRESVLSTAREALQNFYKSEIPMIGIPKPSNTPEYVTDNHTPQRVEIKLPQPQPQTQPQPPIEPPAPQIPDMSNAIKQFQTEIIQSVVNESLETFRRSIHQDIQNLHVELLRQFQMQQNELADMLEKYTNTKSLLDEIDQLKRENYRLRNMH